jgi:hypothetical protein
MLCEPPTRTDGRMRLCIVSGLPEFSGQGSDSTAHESAPAVTCGKRQEYGSLDPTLRAGFLMVI